MDIVKIHISGVVNKNVQEFFQDYDSVIIIDKPFNLKM